MQKNYMKKELNKWTLSVRLRSQVFKLIWYSFELHRYKRSDRHKLDAWLYMNDSKLLETRLTKPYRFQSINYYSFNAYWMEILMKMMFLVITRVQSFTEIASMYFVELFENCNKLSLVSVRSKIFFLRKKLLLEIFEIKYDK